MAPDDAKDTQGAQGATGSPGRVILLSANRGLGRHPKRQPNSQTGAPDVPGANVPRQPLKPTRRPLDNASSGQAPEGADQASY